MTNYFNYKPRFNRGFLENNLSRIKDNFYLDDKNSKTLVFIIY